MTGCRLSSFPTPPGRDGDRFTDKQFTIVRMECETQIVSPRRCGVVMDEEYVQEHFDFGGIVAPSPKRSESRRRCYGRTSPTGGSGCSSLQDFPEEIKSDKFEEKMGQAGSHQLPDLEDRQHGDPPICSRTSRAHSFQVSVPLSLLAR